MNYRFTPFDDSFGTFNLRVVGGYLHRLTFFNTPGAEPDEDSGEVDPINAPKYLGTLDLTWMRGPLSVNYGLAWQDNVRRFTREQLIGNPDLSDPRFFFFKERWEHDIQVAYDVDERFNIYAGINNFTDEQPSVGATNFPVSALGRYFYVGVRANLEDVFGF